MSLRRALATLPDDRDSVAAAREVVAYLDRHKDEQLDAGRISSALGMAGSRVDPVLSALSAASVVSVDAGNAGERCVYSPDAVLNLEVRRFLKASSGVDAGLQRRVDRFRGSYGR